MTVAMRFSVVSLVLVTACLPQVGPAVVDDGGVLDDGGTGSGGGAATGGGTSLGGGSATGGGATTGDAGPGSCTDGLHNGAETDVDCGGGICPPCALTQACGGPTDCSSGVCNAGQCDTPAMPACHANFAGCSSFTDLTTTANATIRFPVAGTRYSPPCVRVRLGQSLTFSGDFGSHPLDQGCGPIKDLVTWHRGNTFTVTFTNGLGIYGYYCFQHGSSNGSGMSGAIEVVP
jgi:plastocyanin